MYGVRIRVRAPGGTIEKPSVLGTFSVLVVWKGKAASPRSFTPSINVIPVRDRGVDDEIAVTKRQFAALKITSSDLPRTCAAGAGHELEYDAIVFNQTLRFIVEIFPDGKAGTFVATYTRGPDEAPDAAAVAA